MSEQRRPELDREFTAWQARQAKFGWGRAWSLLGLGVMVLGLFSLLDGRSAPFPTGVLLMLAAWPPVWDCGAAGRVSQSGSGCG